MISPDGERSVLLTNLQDKTRFPAPAVIDLYFRRWAVEPLFHNLKRWWGVTHLCQQSRKALELWMQIRSTAWTLAQLLALVAEDSFPVQAVAPWRAKQPLTAGLIAQWLRIDKPEPIGSGMALTASHKNSASLNSAAIPDYACSPHSAASPQLLQPSLPLPRHRSLRGAETSV